MRRLIIGAALAVLAIAPAAATDHWPQFRGTQAGVADDDPALPDRWSEKENVRWKTSIPGLGWSSPILWGDHVFVTTAISDGNEVPPIKGLFDPIGGHSRNKSAAPHIGCCSTSITTPGPCAGSGRCMYSRRPPPSR